jgi:large subunit ribosomal protein L6
MAVIGRAENEIQIPDGVRLSVSPDAVTAKGKAGEIARKVNFGRVDAAISGNVLKLSIEMPSRQELANLNTITSEIRSMIEGVSKGFEYRLRIVYAHFPIKVQVKGTEVVIENFLGERHPRRASIVGGAKVSISGDQVTVSSASVEHAGQTAANIERATRIKNYDRRVFQDGIYIVSKAGKALS